jgi:replication factor A1
MLVGDWSSNSYVTAFSEAGEQLFGKPAQDIGEILDSEEQDVAEKFLAEVSFTPKLFKMRTKVETYQDTPRQKTIALNISDVNYKEYNKHLLADITRLTGISVAKN